MSRIFLSHSSLDSFQAVALLDWLATEGWRDVFLDLDPKRGLVAGERWERGLHDAATRCEAVIFLVSPHWLASGWCLKEYSLAQGLNKKLFAVIVDPQMSIADMPSHLSGTWQALDLTGGQDLRLHKSSLPGSHEEKHVAFSASGLSRLRRGLRKAGLDPLYFAWPPERDPHRAPYRGLKPFEAADAGIFFGRDAPIVEALDRLRGLHAGSAPRLLVVLGASGAGKSSFLRAGLLPRLARDDTNFVPLLPVRPERAAISGENGLVRALEALCPERTRAELRRVVQDGVSGLRPILQGLAPGPSSEQDRTTAPALVLAIDQTEELFRPEGAEEARALLEIVRDLTVGDDPKVIVIFAIRSDDYDSLEHAVALQGLPQATLPLLPMHRGAYKELIEGPAKRYAASGNKLAIEAQLTQRLLEDIEDGGSDALPLLSFTLEQLYLEFHKSNRITLADYVSIGGLKGAIDAATQRVFAKADADGRIPRDRSAREALLRRGLIPWLAGIDPDTRSPRRNIARRADIPVEAAPLIDLLVEERLLSTDIVMRKDPADGREQRVATIEPTHEALLRQWGLLEGWIAADFGLLATLEGLKRAAVDWDSNGRSDAWLAHQGQRLDEAQALEERPDIAARLDEADRQYLAFCRSREIEAFNEAERRSREREEAQAARLAAAQALAAASRRLVRRTGAGLLVAIALAGVSAWQWRRADTTLDAATSTANAMVLDLAKSMRDRTGMPADLVAEVLRNARRLQLKLMMTSGNDPALLLSSAKGLNEIVLTEFAFGDVQQAQEAARAFIETAEKLVALDLKNRESRRYLSFGLNRIGDASMRAARYREANAFYQKAVVMRSELLDEDPAAPEARGDLAAAEEKLGEALHAEGGDTNNRAAAAAYVKAQAFRQGLVDEAPDNHERQRDLTLSFEHRAELARDFGDDEEAMEFLRKSLAIRERLAAARPNDAQSRRDLANCLDQIGLTALQSGEIDGALRVFEKSLDLRSALSRSDPTNIEWQRDIAVSFAHQGDALLARPDKVSALERYHRSIAIRQKLSRERPDNPVWQTDLALDLRRLALAGENPRSNLQQALRIADDLGKRGRLPDRAKSLPADIAKQLESTQP